MAQRHQNFNVVAPAGTPSTDPLEVLTRFEPGHARSVRVVVPGVSGAGVGIAYAHQVIIPHAGQGFILSTDTSQSLPFDLDDYPTGGAWSAFVFNTTAVDCVFGLHFAVDELESALPPFRPVAIDPLRIYDIAAAQ